MSHSYQACINYRIQRIAKVYRRRAEERLSALGLHPGQEFLLMQLWDKDGITQSELFERLCVEPSTVTKSLQRLEKVGFVERRPDAEDSRVSRVYLTESGRALQAPVLQIWNELEHATVSGLSEVEIALMVRLFDQIDANLAE